MMMARHFAAGAALLAAFAAPAAAADVAIAVAAPMTGDQAKAGLDLAQAVRLAVDAANAAGGKDVPTIALLVEDDQANPTQAVLVARRLVSGRSGSGLVGVVGHYNSSCSQPASAVYRDAGVIQITPASTNPALSRQGFETFFRTCGTDDQQGPKAATYAVRTLQAKRLFIVDDKTTYGVGLADEFERAAKALGAETMRESIAKGDKDFASILTKAKGWRPELLYFSMIYPDAALLTAQSRRLGIQAALMGGDGVFDPTFITLAGAPAAEGFWATMEGGNITKMASAKAFVDGYTKRFAMPPGPFSGYAYDAANRLIGAIRSAPSRQSKDLLAALRMAGKTDGVTGAIEFDERGDNRHQVLGVYRVKGGAWEYLGEAR